MPFTPFSALCEPQFCLNQTNLFSLNNSKMRHFDSFLKFVLQKKIGQMKKLRGRAAGH
jgi:hypothetical protein